MKTIVLASLLTIAFLSLNGCSSSTPATENDSTAKQPKQLAEPGPTLTPEQAAEFKASVTKKAKKGAKDGQ